MKSIKTMGNFQLNANNSTLLVFIDETGCEDLKDPRNPSFGRAGCAIKAAHYGDHPKAGGV